MARLRSLRWRLTFLYLALLAVLLLAGGIAQYCRRARGPLPKQCRRAGQRVQRVFARSRNKNANRTATRRASAHLSPTFSDELRSRRTSAAIIVPMEG